MKHYLLSLLLFTLFALPAFCQEKEQSEPDWQRIEAARVAHISQRLALSPEQAQAFWPVYNQYTTKREALREEEHTIKRTKPAASEELSEAEALRQINLLLSIRSQEVKLDELYLNKELPKILSAKQTLLLIQAEHEFRRMLLRQLKEKHKKAHAASATREAN
jgi:hypothetical protein